MAIGLDQQPECMFCPLRRIDLLGAIKILQSFSIFADAAIDFPTRPECDKLRIELDHHVKVIKSALRVTKLQPGKMATEVRMRVGRVSFNPAVHDLKITFGIRTK